MIFGFPLPPSHPTPCLGYEVIGVPLDSIWLDIEHTLDKRYLEWDENKFPDPSRLYARLYRRFDDIDIAIEFITFSPHR